MRCLEFRIMLAANVQGLAKCGYSPIRQPGTVVDFYLKFK